MTNAVIYAIATLLTYFLGLYSKKKGWNDKLPIPIQNILIGIGCFLGGLVANYIFNEQMTYEIILQQVTAALGGAGTATLAYDTDKMNK